MGLQHTCSMLMVTKSIEKVFVISNSKMNCQRNCLNWCWQTGCLLLLRVMEIIQCQAVAIATCSTWRIWTWSALGWVKKFSRLWLAAASKDDRKFEIGFLRLTSRALRWSRLRGWQWSRRSDTLNKFRDTASGFGSTKGPLLWFAHFAIGTRKPQCRISLNSNSSRRCSWGRSLGRPCWFYGLPTGWFFWLCRSFPLGFGLWLWVLLFYGIDFKSIRK